MIRRIENSNEQLNIYFVCIVQGIIIFHFGDQTNESYDTYTSVCVDNGTGLLRRIDTISRETNLSKMFLSSTHF